MLKNTMPFIIIFILSITSIAISNNGEKTSKKIQKTIKKIERVYNIRISDISISMKEDQLTITNVKLKDGTFLSSQELVKIEESILKAGRTSEPGI